MKNVLHQKALLWLNTLAGRLAITLAIGSFLGVAISLWMAVQYRSHSLNNYRASQVALSSFDIAKRLRVNRADALSDLRERRISATRLLEGFPQGGTSSSQLDEELAEQFKDDLAASGRIFPAETCLGDMRKVHASQPAGLVQIVPDCWVVEMTFGDGQSYVIGFMMPPIPRSLELPLLPFFMAVSAFICISLSVVLANFALRYVTQLRDASTQFAKDLNSPPLSESGPIDIRETYAAFNAMQRRLRSMFKERSEMLAAVSHDLQTPLTRLRLRVEALPPGIAQNKILTDLDSMERLVAEGLQLAMAHEANEDWVRTELKSLLASAVEDANDSGKNVILGETQKVYVRLKPDALSRCLQNLIDNAIFYGGDAVVSNYVENGVVTVKVDDNGPGIPHDQIDAMFTPFKRGETSRSRNTGGTGIGLSIARAQAEAIGATVTLTNRKEGGLSATITIPLEAH